MAEEYLGRLMESIDRAAQSASAKTDEALLTDTEKFSLAYYAGVPYEVAMEGMKFTLRTTGLVGFACVHGQWHVFHRPIEKNRG